MIITVEIIFGLILLFVAFWQASLLYSSIFGAPTVYANKQAVADALKLAETKKGETVLDLGCGNANSLIIAARKFGARGIGVEISPYCYLKSRWNVRLTQQSKNIRIYLSDLKKAKELIKSADVLYLYLLNCDLAKIEDEVFENIKSNCRVVTLAFQFPNKKPIKTIATRNLGRETTIKLYVKS